MMRFVRFGLFVVVALVAAAAVACSSSGGGGAVPPDGGGLDGGVVEGGGAAATCSGVVMQTPPATNACTGDPAQCLAGKATTSFMAEPKHRCASVFRTFPEGNAQPPLQSQLVAADGTWAFSGLPSWDHYYVFFVDDFQVGPEAGSGVPATVGTLTVPVASSDASPALQVEVKPVQLALLESRSAGGNWQVQWASAHVFNPSVGSQIAGGAQVSVVIGGASTALPWVMPAMSAPLYFVQFASPPAAQPSYTILTADPSLGTRPVGWNLIAAPPAFEGTITAPADGTTVPASAPLVVSWGAQPAADFILTELFERVDGGWTNPYSSPQPNDSTVTSETIPKEYLSPGHYLLNVSFATASCPATADGCVLANSIAAAQFTAQ